MFPVHEVLGTELEKEDSCFSEFPDIFGNNHREFIVHALELVNPYELPARNRDDQFDLKVEEIHYYRGTVTWFYGNPQKEVQTWEGLLSIYRHQKVENRKRSWTVRLLDVCHRRNQGKDLKRCWSTICLTMNKADLTLTANTILVS